MKPRGGLVDSDLIFTRRVSSGGDGVVLDTRGETGGLPCAPSASAATDGTTACECFLNPRGELAGARDNSLRLPTLSACIAALLS